MKNYDNMLSRFHLIPERHGQTDRIAISISRVSVLTRDKKIITIRDVGPFYALDYDVLYHPIPVFFWWTRRLVQNFHRQLYRVRLKISHDLVLRFGNDGFSDLFRKCSKEYKIKT